MIDWLKLWAWAALSLLKLAFREKKDACITSVESLMKQRRASGLFSFQAYNRSHSLPADDNDLPFRQYAVFNFPMHIGECF